MAAGIICVVFLLQLQAVAVGANVSRRLEERKVYNNIMIMYSYKYCCSIVIVCLNHIIIGIKRKHTRKEGAIQEVIKALADKDKEAEELYEVKAEKRMRMFYEAEEMRRQAYAGEEEKRRQDERRHEENMQYMFLSFMQQVLPMTARQGVNPPAGPAYDPTYGVPHASLATQQPRFAPPPFPGSPEGLPPFTYDEPPSSRSS